MSSNEIPERWAQRLVDKGFTDRRSKKDPRPSMSALAERLGVHASTISNAINGRREPEVSTINGLVRELGPDVAGWLGVAHFGTWQPPESSTLLNLRQRAIIEALITSITIKEEGNDSGMSAEKSDDDPNGGGDLIEGNFPTQRESEYDGYAGPEPDYGQIAADEPGTPSGGQVLREDQDESVDENQDEGHGEP